MGLKDNFRQAVKELVGESESVQPRTASAPEPVPPAAEPEGIQFQDTALDLKEGESFMNSYSSAQPGLPEDAFDEFARPAEPGREVSIIAPGTVVRGSIESDCDLECYGEIQGDIVTSRNLQLKGKVCGNATGDNVDLRGVHMVGNVVAAGTATLDAGSEVEGDVTADSVVMNGKIQGNVQVSKCLSMESDAVICGRVTADKLSVDEGAVIQGEIFIGASMLPSKTGRPEA